MSKTKLQPCPFCGCDKPTFDEKKNVVECPDCGGMMVYYSNLPVIEEWNTRAEDKRLAELRASYEEYGDRLASVIDSNESSEAALKISIGMSQWYFAQVKNRNAEIAQLRAELDEAYKLAEGEMASITALGITKLVELHDAYEVKISELNVRSLRYREALEWYADQKNYSYGFPGRCPNPDVHPKLQRWMADEGDTARAALKDAP